jgi:hypothetical protein
MKIENRNTRYYVDIDTITKKVIGWDFGDRFDLIKEPEVEGLVRIFITKGQYNKLLNI